MAQNVVINGVTYANVPSVSIPKSSGGTAAFYDTSGATAGASQILDGYTAFGAAGQVSGGITQKAAQTYTPTTTDQTIAAGQYLAGAQTVKGDANLQPQYIADGVKIFGVTGSLSAAVISQDSSTKVLSIS